MNEDRQPESEDNVFQDDLDNMSDDFLSQVSEPSLSEPSFSNSFQNEAITS
ncbi:27548_t:CDS:2 [Dentiscutata erythropus]|uniref:27548_t:CDS:1 n=1 Tax=Dentiscutata erythropus TaxID=1348616 RepID=A0A9N9NIL1_9GLOM|nr:27548_t:CDS:2 [Dentiscutata erythropus]